MSDSDIDLLSIFKDCPYWMTIGGTSYGIPGSNNEWSIGGWRRTAASASTTTRSSGSSCEPKRMTRLPTALPDREARPARQHALRRVASDLYAKDPTREQMLVERLRALDLLQYVDAIALHRAIDEHAVHPFRSARSRDRGSPRGAASA